MRVGEPLMGRRVWHMGIGAITSDVYATLADNSIEALNVTNFLVR
jgi:hypothetical protein